MHKVKHSKDWQILKSAPQTRYTKKITSIISLYLTFYGTSSTHIRGRLSEEWCKATACVCSLSFCQTSEAHSLKRTVSYCIQPTTAYAHSPIRTDLQSRHSASKEKTPQLAWLPLHHAVQPTLTVFNGLQRSSATAPHPTLCRTAYAHGRKKG